MGLSYSISDEVFARFPGYVRGVVLAYDVSNAASSPELLVMLRAAEAAVRQSLSLDQLTQQPRLAAWRDAFRLLGFKPSEFRPSIEALVRRVLHDQELPTINALVDIGNIVSLRHLVPVGSHAIDHLTQDIALRPASGGEVFVPFGSDQPEHPAEGEIVFAEGDTVLTRRWVWRQSTHTLTLPGTTAVEFNVDGLPPVPEAEVTEICREIIALTERFCGGKTSYHTLTRHHPSLRF